MFSGIRQFAEKESRRWRETSRAGGEGRGGRKIFGIHRSPPFGGGVISGQRRGSDLKKGSREARPRSA